jgi:hypothetical protein
MASIPDPRTWYDGEIVSPENLNTEIRDALKFLLNPPAVAVRMDVDVPITNNTWTRVPFDTVLRDTDGISDALAPGLYTVVTPGLYISGMNVIFESNTTGRRDVAIYVNGENLGRMSGPAAPGGGVTGLSVSRSLILAVGDTVEFKVYQGSGADLDIRGLTSAPERSGGYLTWLAQ